VQELEQQYLPAYANEVAYLNSTWLNPYKQKLVKGWVGGGIGRAQGMEGIAARHVEEKYCISITADLSKLLPTAS
jgi:hypothetical protein